MQVYHVICFAATNLDSTVDSYSFQKIYLQITGYSNKTFILNSSQLLQVSNSVSLIYSTSVRTQSFTLIEEVSVYTSKSGIIGKAVELLVGTITQLQSLRNSSTSMESTNSTTTSAFVTSLGLYLQLIQLLGKSHHKLYSYTKLQYNPSIL